MRWLQPLRYAFRRFQPKFRIFPQLVKPNDPPAAWLVGFLFWRRFLNEEQGRTGALLAILRQGTSGFDCRNITPLLYLLWNSLICSPFLPQKTSVSSPLSTHFSTHFRLQICNHQIAHHLPCIAHNRHVNGKSPWSIVPLSRLCQIAGSHPSRNSFVSEKLRRNLPKLLITKNRSKTAPDNK